MRGLEPPPGLPDTDLNRARLPIPPHPRAGRRANISHGTCSRRFASLDPARTRAAIVQGTRTPPSHGGNPGSNPGSGTSEGPANRGAFVVLAVWPFPDTRSARRGFQSGTAASGRRDACRRATCEQAYNPRRAGQGVWSAPRADSGNGPTFRAEYRPPNIRTLRGRWEHTPAICLFARHIGRRYDRYALQFMVSSRRRHVVANGLP
jgi:hypothetical protein